MTVYDSVLLVHNVNDRSSEDIAGTVSVETAESVFTLGLADSDIVPFGFPTIAA